MRRALRNLIGTAALGAALAVAGAARADIVILVGTDNTGTENILLDPGALDAHVAGLGETTGGQLDLVGTENTTATTSGQLAVLPSDGEMSGLSVIPTANTNLLLKFVVNLDAVADGSVSFTVEQAVGGPFVDSFFVAGNGQNFFTISAINGQKITRIDIAGLDGVQFSGFRSIRAQFEGLPPVTGVPEPAAWATMILGLGLAGATLRRHARPRLPKPAPGGG